MTKNDQLAKNLVACINSFEAVKELNTHSLVLLSLNLIGLVEMKVT